MTVPWQQQINRHPLGRIAALDGQPNGQLSPSVLVAVRDGNGNICGLLEATVARSWAAMVAAARADGIILGATDTYRDLAHQIALLHQRYDHTDHGHGGFVWGGEHWYLKSGFAPIAPPGTSNHGYGRAVDGARANESGPGLEWLENNAVRFGWEWELSSEVWHIHYWAGDAIPQAVTDYQPANVQEDDDMTFILTPDHGAVLFAFGKLVHVETIPGIDKDQNQWDLKGDAKTWANVQKAYGPVIAA